jgi:AraC family transcriptional regulator of adaptative response/methylated-DNA-[protein]-cysteine methyltransferase
MERFKDHLREGDSVTDAIYQAGYGSSSRLYERVSEELGMTPTDYQRGGDQQTLFYTTAPCALGVLMVAATERGLCAVRLGHSANALVVELADEFDGATCLPDETRLTTAVTAILSYIDGQTSDLDLPLDIKATAFQRRVWDALRQIPCGETRSYGEVAEAIGQPTASRAVGNACANNPVALVVPCHRVVKSGGAMGNYRWGIERKERLLEAEREHSG